MNFKITNPVQGTVQKPSSGRSFGAKRSGHKHEGIDITVPSGTQVLSAADGEVVNSEYQDKKNCGGFVRIKHTQDGNKFYTKYCHLKDIKVQKGKMVKAGEVIGVSGGGKNDPHRGSSTGAHLHFEIEDVAGNPYDPYLYLNKGNAQPTIDTPKESPIDMDMITDLIDPKELSKSLNPFNSLGIYGGLFGK
jgi:murein DD-endopeptidase MepM/ murein hydrolase activator NlpD